jgi:MFS family permease
MLRRLVQDHRKPVGVFAPGRRLLTVGILLSIASFAIEGMGVVPALPTAVAALHGLELFGWAFSAFMLAWIVGTVAGGVLADARGPRLPMTLGLFGFSAGLLLAGSAHSMLQFLAGRTLQGCGGGAIMAAAYVAIARGYDDTQRARMMALTSSVWIVPALVGPALSGAVTQWFGWRLVFLGAVPLVACSALLVLPPLREFETRSTMARSPRVAWSFAAAVGAGAILASPSASGMTAALVLALAGALLLVRALPALLPAGTLRARRGLPAGVLTRALLSFAFFGTEAFIPRGAGELRGASPTEAGLALSAGALGWIGASWWQAQLEARHGPAARALRLRAGLMLVACAIALVAVTLLSAQPFALLPLAWALGGAGVGLSYSAGGLLCLAAAPSGREGEVTGQLQLAEALCTAAAAGLGGALLWALGRAQFSPRQAHAVVFGTTFTAALLGVMIAGRSATPTAPKG